MPQPAAAANATDVTVTIVAATVIIVAVVVMVEIVIIAVATIVEAEAVVSEAAIIVEAAVAVVSVTTVVVAAVVSVIIAVVIARKVRADVAISVRKPLMLTRMLPQLRILKCSKQVKPDSALPLIAVKNPV